MKKPLVGSVAAEPLFLIGAGFGAETVQNDATSRSSHAMCLPSMSPFQLASLVLGLTANPALIYDPCVSKSFTSSVFF